MRTGRMSRAEFNVSQCHAPRFDSSQTEAHRETDTETDRQTDGQRDRGQWTYECILRPHFASILGCIRCVFFSSPFSFVFAFIFICYLHIITRKMRCQQWQTWRIRNVECMSTAPPDPMQLDATRHDFGLPANVIIHFHSALSLCASN